MQVYDRARPRVRSQRTGKGRLRAARPHTTISVLLFACAAGLIPWTVYLDQTLPVMVGGHHFRIFWVSYDMLLTLAFAATAWLTLRQRKGAFAAAAATAILLILDACLDTVWSRPGWHLVMAVVRADLVELPAAVLILYAAHRLLRPRGHATRRHRDEGLPGHTPAHPQRCG